MNIVGQNDLLRRLDELIADNSLPRFIIITGARRCGKNMIVKYLSEKLGECIEVEQSTEAVREAIRTCYNVATPTIYRLNNIANMHPNAKNSLLKVTEEPPRLSYFIATVTDLNDVLPTLKSRSYIVRMKPYLKEIILDYARELDQTWNLTPEVIKILGILCETPGEVNDLMKLDISQLWKDVENYILNIGKVSGVENFKVRQLLKIKEADKGYDIDLFMSTCKKYCRWILEDVPYHLADKIKFSKTVDATSKYLNELNIKSINKSNVVDAWIMALREIWK